jgi:mannan endo-1,4-beta-mannosidase
MRTIKIYFLFLCIFLNTTQLFAQLGETISISGKHILGPCGDTLILRGVNYAPYNWGWSPTQLNINQIGLSGANAVRLVWYKNPTGATPISTYGNLTNLDSALSKCVQQNMIPILTLHDQTCQNSPSALVTLATWYTQPSVVALINKYKHSLIINIANEALYVNWTGNPTSAQTSFTNTYTTIVNNLRSAGIVVPLMIDGPDCGTNLNVLTNIGNTLQNNDPLHRLIFSAHAYWYSYANNDSLQMLSLINNAVNANIPFLFGEIANSQDDATMCQYSLNYQALLNICKTKNIGWLAWSWDNDGCASRQITSAGNFASLTPYGNQIINHANFGLQTYPPAKSQYLVHDACQMKIKTFLSGYYSGAQTMRNVLYLQNIIPSPSNQVDTIQIEFHQSNSPYSSVYTTKTILQTNGNAFVNFPLSLIGSSYYIAIKHRNTIETWSANPIMIGSITHYDYTNAMNKAYGSNQIEVSSGVWALYTGDINQDDNIDLLDNSQLELGIQNFLFGYQIEDLNGDGNVDLLDGSIIEDNINGFIFSIHP